MNSQTPMMASWLLLKSPSCLSGFSPSGNALQDEIAMAYFSLAICGDSELTNQFIKGHRLVQQSYP
jgi:hypothetical protein